MGSSAGGSGLILAGLGTHQSAKSKHVNMMYSQGLSYKKPKKPVAGVVVNSSANTLGLENLGGAGIKPGISWGSKVDSITSSISDLSDIENMANTIAEKTNYTESDKDDNMDETMPRKTCTWMFVLGNPLNDDDIVLDLSSRVDIGSNQFLLLGSRAPKIRNFNMTKFFALNIELSAVPGKLVSDKLISLKKIFYHVNGLGGASTPSKFLGIIRSSFTSEFSLNKAREMTICEKILVNNNEVIIKEIPIDLPRLAVESVFSKFGKIALVELELSEVANQIASMWSVFMGKDSVCMALAINNKQIDQHWALLYTLSVDITAHNLSDLLVFYDGKSCFISCNPSLYVRDRCAVICFGDEVSKLAAISTIPIFKSVVSDQNQVCLAGIYKKKMAPIAWPVSFGGKTWAQVAGNSSSHMVLLDVSGSGSPSSIKPFSITSGSLDISDLSGHMASLECSLEFLANQISGIVKKLSFVELVSLVSSSYVSPSDVSVSVILVVDSDMALDGGLILSTLFVSGVNVLNAVLSLSGLKVFTSKVGGLKSKMSALEASIDSVLFPYSFFIPMSNLVWKFVTCKVWGINVPAKQTDIVCWHVSSGNMVFFVTETKLKFFVGPWIKDKFDEIWIFTSGLNVSYLGASVAVIMNNSLAHYVSKVEEIFGQVVSVQLLFKGKLSVTVLGLYTGTSPGIHFSQMSEVNSIIAKAVNISTFIVLGGDFNESRGVEKTIDYIFVSKNLSSTVAKHWIGSVSEFFDTDHSAVMVLVGLGGLLNAQLDSLHKQTNKNCWKFKIRDADSAK
ncbi:hypothetical protein G9A89_005965 [Geosiphon pyriformis]|nr:hypothetical protein G9A89_005965 [Geosiphon pyriformis]